MTAHPIDDPDLIMQLLFRLYPREGQSARHPGVHLLNGDGEVWITTPGINAVLAELTEPSSVLTGAMGVAISRHTLSELRGLGLIATPHSYVESVYVVMPLKVRRAMDAGAATIEDIESRLASGQTGTSGTTVNVTGRNVSFTTGPGNAYQYVSEVEVGNDADLARALVAAGLGDKDVTDLRRDADADAKDAGRPSIGRRLSERITVIAPRVVEAGVLALAGNGIAAATMWLVYLVAAWLGVPI